VNPDATNHVHATNRIAVYTGSFDPVTLGHLHIIRRAAQLFDRLIVGIGFNAEKRSLFTAGEREELLGRVTQDLPNVEIQSFDGLAVRFVRQCGARVMVRGVRPLTDIAGEFTMMMANRQLDEDIETVFLMADEEFAHVSSSLIKQIALLSDDQMLARFVPPAIIQSLREKLLEQQTTR
jgi:pantetheine-phosphate adenylyltransferase